MAALNPLTPRNPADERPSHEPSMEEILASIRRIISDDQSLGAPAEADAGIEASAPPAPVPPEPARTAASASKWPYADAPINTRDFGPSEADAPERRQPEPYSKPLEPKLFFSKPPEAKQSVPEAKRAELKPSDFSEMRLRQRLEEDVDETGVSPKFRRSSEPVPVLQEHISQEETPIVSPATDAAVASSFNALLTSKLMPNSEMLAEMAREMLRPMLKAWLDDNLPVMVERLVRAEIERVARGGR